MPARLRARLHRELDPAQAPEGTLSALNRVVLAAVLASVALTVLESEPLIRAGREGWFFAAEVGFTALFAVEYAARLWTATERPEHAHPVWGRLRYALSLSALTDLLALAPLLLGLLGGEAFMLRLIRVLRILRLARLGRFSMALHILGDAVRDRRFELGVSLIFAAGLLLLSSTVLHLIEGGLQPETFGSIPRAMWWSVATLTTVGYGDVTPVTAGGKLFAGLTAVTGIGLIAMPTGILAAAFSDALQRHREVERRRAEARRTHPLSSGSDPS